MSRGRLCGCAVALLGCGIWVGKIEAQATAPVTTTVVTITHQSPNSTVTETSRTRTPGALQPTSPPAKDKAPDAVTLSPNDEKRLAHLTVMVEEIRDKVWKSKMESEITEIVKLTQLNQAGIDSLGKAAQPIVDQYAKDWAHDFESAIRHSLYNMPPGPGSEQVLIQYESMAELFAANDMISEVTPPSESDEWIKAVHSTLTPDQATIWDKDRAEKRAKFEAEMKDPLETVLKEVRSSQNLASLQRCHQIETDLALVEAQKSKLEEAAKTASDQSADQLKGRISAMLYVMDSATRKAFLSSVGNFRAETGKDLAEGYSYDNQPAWKSALSLVLTSEERDRLDHLGPDLTAGRVQMMGLALIAVLDQKVGFTPAQRDQLKPLAEKLVAADSVLCPKDGKPQQFSLDYLLGTTKKATDAELVPILDSDQLARWHALNHADDQTPEPVDASSAPDKEKAVAMEQEPEHVEEVLSKKMYEEEQSERKSIIDSYSIKAEEVIRVLKPGPDSSEKLKIAVLGMSEKQLAGWKSVSEQQIRNQLSDADPNTIDEKMPMLQRYIIRFAPGQNGNGVEQQWTNVLKETFSADQLKVIKKDNSTRQDFLEMAASSVVLGDFCQQYSLDEKQTKKLKPLFEKVMKDYEPDIPYCFFQGVESVPWFLTPNFEFLPMAGISDADMKSILNDDQMNSWNNSSEHSNAAAYWQQFQQVHQNRMQQADKGGDL